MPSIPQDIADGIEAVGRGTDVAETVVIEQDLLNNEGGDGPQELAASVHYA